MQNQKENELSENNSTASLPPPSHDAMLEHEQRIKHVQTHLSMADDLNNVLEKFTFLDENCPCQAEFKDLMLSLSESDAWDDAETRIRQVDFIEEMREICGTLSKLAAFASYNHILIIKSGQSLMAAELEALELLRNMPEFNN